MFHIYFFTELSSKKVKSLETELNEMTSAYKQIMDDLLEKVDEIETYVLSPALSFFSSLTYRSTVLREEMQSYIRRTKH